MPSLSELAIPATHRPLNAQEQVTALRIAANRVLDPEQPFTCGKAFDYQDDDQICAAIMLRIVVEERYGEADHFRLIYEVEKEAQISALTQFNDDPTTTRQTISDLFHRTANTIEKEHNL